MAIHIPGQRDRRGRVKAAKRSVVAVLSLTAMVDMFTVLAVFLLQNYAVTGEVLHIAENVKLPQASSVKELRPANVVVISETELSLNEEKIADFLLVKEQGDWLIEPLRKKIVSLIEAGEEEKLQLKNQIRTAVVEAKSGVPAEDQLDAFRRMTIQADEGIDFLTIKKIMYTLTDAGVAEINFAVIKKPDNPSGS